MNIAFQANDSAGAAFLAGMSDIEKKWRIARGLFSEFISQHGYSAWHIHDGWVTHKYQNGDVLHNSEINITWISEHAGYSHTSMRPEIGEKMVIIERSPDGETRPFKMYCYEVVDDNARFHYERITLKFLEVKDVVFSEVNNRYEFHIPKRLSFWARLFKKL